MIPQADIFAWRETAPWVSDAHVEQDLILSRALVELFSDETVREHLAFRGGTALNKLHP
jgi:predicted nucleotidyltransferase component of viral defense system